MLTNQLLVSILLLINRCVVCMDPHFLVVSPTRITKIFNTNVTTLPITGLKNAVACDYDIASGYLFFTDVAEHNIRRANLDGTNVTTIVDTNIKHPDGLAVDWISKVVYWTDMELGTIDAISYDGNHRVRLIDTDLDSPRAIVVSPVEGYMWWTDWGETPKIERAWLDGTNRQAIITTSLGWPNGLTIDYVTRNIFWADAKLDKIERSSYDGSNRVVLLEQVPHPFSMSLYRDHILWTDWYLGSVELARKTDGGNRQTIARGFVKPMDIQVVSIYRQMGTNYCKQNNGECPSLCCMRPNNLAPMCLPEGHEGHSGTTTTTRSPYVPPEGIISPDLARMDEGTSKTIQCETTSASEPKTQLTWSGKNLGKVYSSSTIVDDGIISISTLTLTASLDINKEIYTCTAIYNGQVLLTRETHVEVYHAPEAVHWYDTPNKLESTEKQSFTMKCQVAESYPEVRTYWRRLLNGETITLQSTHTTEVPGEHGGKTVIMERTFHTSVDENGAIYWCEATFTHLNGNQIVMNSTQKEMNVLYPLNVELVVQTSLKEGQDLTATCETSGGNPSVPETYEWSLNGRILLGENARILTRSPVLRTEGGTYKCRAKTRAGTSFAERNVQIFYPPDVKLNIVPLSIKEGDHVTMTCSVEGGNPVDIDTYTWEHRGQMLIEERGETLVLSPVKRDQTGLYTCKASNEGGQEADSKFIDVMYPPIVHLTTSKDKVKVGESLTLTCQTTGGKPVATESQGRIWSRGGDVIQGEYGRTIVISSMSSRYAGIYSCSIRTPGGTGSARRAIAVLDKPIVTIGVDPSEVEEGDLMTITCHIRDDEPQTTFSWKHNNVTIHGETGVHLVRHPVLRKDSGDYECHVVNEGGVASARTSLNVLYEPEIDTGKNQTMKVDAKEGEKAVFLVHLLANPTIMSIRCVKNNSDSRLTKTVQTLKLLMTIDAVETADYGKHMCVVNNTVGSVEFSLHLERPTGLDAALPNAGEVTDGASGTTEPPGSSAPVIGAAVGVVVLVILVAAVVIVVRDRRRKERPGNQTSLAPHVDEFTIANPTYDTSVVDIGSRPPMPLPNDASDCQPRKFSITALNMNDYDGSVGESQYADIMEFRDEDEEGYVRSIKSADTERLSNKIRDIDIDPRSLDLVFSAKPPGLSQSSWEGPKTSNDI